jgi:hypothetical protein
LACEPTAIFTHTPVIHLSKEPPTINTPSFPPPIIIPATIPHCCLQAATSNASSIPHASPSKLGPVHQSCCSQHPSSSPGTSFPQDFLERLASSLECSSAMLFRSVSNASDPPSKNALYDVGSKSTKNMRQDFVRPPLYFARNVRDSCFKIAVGHRHAGDQPQSCWNMPCLHYPHPTFSTLFALGLNSWLL